MKKEEKGSMICLKREAAQALLNDKHSPGLFDFLFKMMEHMDEENRVELSYEELEEVSGLSYSTVARRISKLKQKGILLQFLTGHYNRRGYIINPLYIQVR